MKPKFIKKRVNLELSKKLSQDYTSRFKLYRDFNVANNKYFVDVSLEKKFLDNITFSTKLNFDSEGQYQIGLNLGINASGPLPCDTSFITAYKNKNHDCIVGMYHDALQSGLKAFGFDRGVTVQGGMPVPITTPAHGTAFDIAGKNIANLEPTLQSFKIALKMSKSLLNE